MSELGLLRPPPPLDPCQPLTTRLAELDWQSIEQEISESGYAETPPVLTPGECAGLADLFPDDRRFRARIDMARHRFGIGVYKYFTHPLPDLVATLRTVAYAALAPVANRWQEALGSTERYPDTHAAFLDQCVSAGQTRPTPLLLRYEPGGYNCLHQDLYGACAFPMQVLVFLDRPGVDYTGGEFLLVEQRPRAQSAGTAIAGRQGALLVFPTRYRPVKGSRGYYRASLRHGVSRVRRGTRHALGVIFHDAR